MKVEYGIEEFRRDLVGVNVGKGLPANYIAVLRTLLDGCFEAWVEHLAEITDVLIFIESNRTVRRTMEIVCVVDGKPLKIENKRACAWEDYNGLHFFTNHLCLYANSEQAIKKILANFIDFLKSSGRDFLIEKTIRILPAYSEAFIHRMPKEVQAFYFPHRRFLLEI
jgi:hypothetical protein